MYGARFAWSRLLRRALALVLPLLLVAVEAAALPIKVKPRGRKVRFTGGTRTPIRSGGGTGGGSNTTTRHRAANTSAGGRFAASRNQGTGGSGGSNTTVTRNNATLGREQATRQTAQGGGNGTGDGTVQGTRQGIFGVPDGSGGTTGARNGLDGSDAVVATHRLTPDGIVVVRNQPGAHLSRGGAFGQAKRVAGIPVGATPRRVFYERLTDQRRGTDLRRQSRVYEFDGADGTTIQIREHSYGHAQDMAGPHFNVDVFDRYGAKVNDSYLPRGADRHFYFAR